MFNGKRVIENYSAFDHKHDAAKHHFSLKDRLHRGSAVGTRGPGGCAPHFYSLRIRF